MDTRSSFGARRLAGLLLIPLAAVACSDSPQAPDSHAASVSVYLQDAPGDVDSVWVQVDGVTLRGEEGTDVVLLDESTPLINLTALRDEAVALAEAIELEAGAYTELRVVIGGGVLQSSSGDVYVMGDVEHPHGLAATGELHCPSCAQSGLKVKLPHDVDIVDGENGILLDFDVSQSFGHRAGQSGRWLMHPVIHATAADPEDIETGEAGGEISGTIALGLDESGQPIEIPTCEGEDRTLEDFVPVAIATTLFDDGGLALEFAGEVDLQDDGTAEFEIDVTDFDLFLLSYLAEVELTTEKLVWEATVDPTEVTLSEDLDEVDGFTYTVTSVACVAIAP